eukprot:CAMPEP_0197588146 /NCGR_PEP_ID=MMETSP1326-20131121/9534_1 /TAXON_ID=1155430 /ORGANISM="Genus nov. species nov., Strain RCC2288" /LENGTH=80 /DNA_ID=CAMNT_0043152943 /DNA_START=52 /DNA_END=290 /DNA_ORIENTATION=-
MGCRVEVKIYASEGLTLPAAYALSASNTISASASGRLGVDGEKRSRMLLRLKLNSAMVAAALRCLLGAVACRGRRLCGGG